MKKHNKTGTWVAIIAPAGGSGEGRKWTNYTFGGASADPVEALEGVVIRNWKSYLQSELPSPWVFISSEQRSVLETQGQMQDFLKKMANPVFMSRMFHRAHYEALMKRGILIGNGWLAPGQDKSQAILWYCCSDSENLTGKRDTELTAEERLEHLRELEKKG
jgi:hypothetical protein